MTDTFSISLPKFQGPFDLLLFFIERDELDISDIPIAKITTDFLAYIREAKAKNIDLASEFIVVAATLMRIKAKMLLPRHRIDEQDAEIDPRNELILRILEYKRYKSILDEMRILEEERASREQRGNALKELRDISITALVDIELQSVTLFKLLRTFEKILIKYEDEKSRVVHRVINYNFTIEGQREFLLITIKKEAESDFEDIFSNLQNRMHAIVTFLALLELLNLQTISIVQGDGMNNFWLSIVKISGTNEN